MSRNMKIILGVVAAVVVLGCIGAFATLGMGAMFMKNSFDPANAEKVAQEITAYQLPAGYHPIMGMNLGVKMAMFGPEGIMGGSSQGMPDAGMLIMLMQAPGSGTNAEQMREQLEQSMSGQMGMGGQKLEATGTKDATIRGQPVTLTVSEGTDRNGESIKSVSGVFEGLGGPSMVMILGRASAWDEAQVDAFLASMQ